MCAILPHFRSIKQIMNKFLIESDVGAHYIPIAIRIFYSYLFPTHASQRNEKKKIIKQNTHLKEDDCVGV